MHSLIKKISVVILILFFFHLFNNAVSQSTDWEKETSKDGQIEILYHVGDRVDQNGGKVQVIEYKAVTETDVPLQKCIMAMRDVSLHKKFMGDTEESKEIKVNSENEWIAYYFFEPPWPMPDNDCVMQVNLQKEIDSMVYIFTGVSKPELLDKKDVKRLNYYEYEYSFIQKANDKVEFSVSVRLTPVSSAPKWMVKTWFPQGPIDFMEKFIKIASEIR